MSALRSGSKVHLCVHIRRHASLVPAHRERPAPECSELAVDPIGSSEGCTIGGKFATKKAISASPVDVILGFRQARFAAQKGGH